MKNKTIDLSVITDIGDEMARQDNRSTQYPLFVIMEDVRRYVDYHDDYDGKERKDPDYADSKDLCKKCRGLEEDGLELPEDCDDCFDEAFVYYKSEESVNVNAGIFMTAKACDEHIKENHYHYNNARSYGVSAWRNPEMQAVQKFILETANQGIPSHYE